MTKIHEMTFRLKCLNLALQTIKDNPERAAQAADTFYRFVNGEGPAQPQAAVDWQTLVARRDPYKLGTVPPGIHDIASEITCGVDVCKMHLHYEVVVWGDDGASWSIDYGRLDGDVTGPEVWHKLSAVLERRYPDAFGNLRQIEMTAVDCGAFSNSVYAWARGRDRVMVVKGKDGAASPPLEFTKRDMHTGLKVCVVWSWPLKDEAQARLADGRWRFSEGHDPEFFKQLTAEAFIVREKNGVPYGEWIKTGPNNALTARLYAMAAAFKIRGGKG